MAVISALINLFANLIVVVGFGYFLYRMERNNQIKDFLKPEKLEVMKDLDKILFLTLDIVKNPKKNTMSEEEIDEYYKDNLEDSRQKEAISTLTNLKIRTPGLFDDEVTSLFREWDESLLNDKDNSIFYLATLKNAISQEYGVEASSPENAFLHVIPDEKNLGSITEKFRKWLEENPKYKQYWKNV